MKTTFYKVRDPKTGLYQKAGSKKTTNQTGLVRVVRPLWSKIGKTWSTKGHVRSHFTAMRESAEFGPATKRVVQYCSDGTVVRKEIPNHAKDPVDPNWEIVELMVEESSTQSAADFMNKVK